MALPPPREASERKKHVLELLESERDAWVATADELGVVCQIPLSFLWHDETLLFSTPKDSVTGLNLATSGQIRIALGGTRDAVIIAATVRTFTRGEIPAEHADAFAAKHEWDPRKNTKTEYAFYLASPTTIQAWRESNELRGRTLMRDGAWRV